MERAPGGEISFQCTTCNQWWGRKYDQWSCTILRVMHPSMTEEDPRFRTEYLPDWLRDRRFYALRDHVAGLTDEVRYQNQLDAIQKTYDEAMEKATPKFSWWASLVRRLNGNS